ncbi:sensor histidine kinase [Parablautia sp. Marseille-Q6255]|uniref:sensor histidine kinase n=1 Tax=Parablautia sp. Marseille-Q6255 TaxID=3039593 RepID=UPI0024BD312F|nr:histidine kinase [Parablautia sp. Marseille-Q6255]
MKTKKGMRQHSMKWTMMGILLVCWLIPFSFLIGVLGFYIASNHSDMTAENFRRQLEVNNGICISHLNTAIADSREASYDGDLLAANDRYRSGEITKVAAEKEYNQYLVSKYQKNDAICAAFLWFAQGEDESIYNIYNERAGATYQLVKKFEREDYEAARAYASGLGTKSGFLYRDGRLYLVRNLIDHTYTERGTLVFCLNQAYCFAGLSSFPSAQKVELVLNGESILLAGDEGIIAPDEKDGAKQLKDGYRWVGDRLYVADVQKGDGYGMSAVMLLRKEISPFPFYGYQYVTGGMVVLLLPLLLFVVFVFQRQVARPVEELSAGAAHIEAGELGFQITTEPCNLEFAYLNKAFNEMSSHLRQQFDRIYQEEIALREARIMALQSHINPHFMNNTLEIINWEARLSGNLRVSHMIEALSTMMDAALDRRKRPEVRLAEEMQYVNSYLYITKERLGKRLTVTCDLGEELMDYIVPRLILQPIVENAVEHGVVPNGTGIVEISGYHDGEYLYLEAVNNGGLSEDDKRRIDRLLSREYGRDDSMEKEPAGNLGIANVNQRLRIMYGAPCGLTIRESTEGTVVALLTMPLRKMNDNIGEMNKTRQEKAH